MNPRERQTMLHHAPVSMCVFDEAVLALHVPATNRVTYHGRRTPSRSSYNRANSLFQSVQVLLPENGKNALYGDFRGYSTCPGKNRPARIAVEPLFSGQMTHSACPGWNRTTRNGFWIWVEP